MPSETRITCSPDREMVGDLCGDYARRCQAVVSERPFIRYQRTIKKHCEDPCPGRDETSGTSSGHSEGPPSMRVSKSVDDEPTGLARTAQSHPVRVMAVTSGKGGVGKTTVSVNLAVAMANRGREVMILDADLGLANVDVMLGLSSGCNISHVLDGECSLEEIMIAGPSGVRVLPGASGLQRMSRLSPLENAGLIRAFGELSATVDVLLVDTAAGLSDSVISFTRASQEVIVVVCDEPASIGDAYALIRVLSHDYDIQRFRILANMTRSAREGVDMFRKLSRITDAYLDVMLDYMGTVPYDDPLRKAVQKQRSVVHAYPRSRAAQAFKNLAQKADNWRIPEKAGGHVEFFVERLIQYTSTPGEVMP